MTMTVALAASIVPAMAAHGNSNLQRARELSKSTSGMVENVKERISSMDADSVASMVVMKIPQESDSTVEEVGTENTPSESIDQDVDTNASLSDVGKTAVSSALLIPIFGIVFGITVPFAAFVLVIYFVCRALVQRKRMKYDTIAKAAEYGHPLPPEFYLTDSPKPKNKLQSGIVWIGWGVACVILTLADMGHGWVAIGMIPLFIGISRLAVYFLEQRKNTVSSKSDSDTTDDAQ